MKVHRASTTAKNTSKNASKRTYQHDNSDSNTHASGQRGYNQHASDTQADNLAHNQCTEPMHRHALLAARNVMVTVMLHGREGGYRLAAHERQAGRTTICCS